MCGNLWKLFWASFCRKCACPAIWRSSLGGRGAVVMPPSSAGCWQEALLSSWEGRSAQTLCRASGIIWAGRHLISTAPVPPVPDQHVDVLPPLAVLLLFCQDSFHCSGHFTLQRSSAAEEWTILKETPLMCHGWRDYMFYAGLYLIGAEMSDGDEWNMS